MDHQHCHHLLSSLSDFVDGTLETELCNEIERHLAGCENCQVIVNTLRKTVDLYHVSAQNQANIPPDVRQRLFHRLNLDEFLRENG